MNKFDQLASDLTTLTGVRFRNENGVVGCDGLTNEQYVLFERTCQQSGLRVLKSMGIEIAIDDVLGQESAVRLVQNMAADEKNRIVRLEVALPLLAQKTGVTFRFDDQHKLLISEDILPPNIPTADASRKIRSIDALGDIIEQTCRMDNDDYHRIMIADADVEKLHAVQNAAASRLINPPTIPRQDTPPRPTGGANRGED